MFRLLFLLFFLPASTCLIGQATFKKIYGTAGNDVPFYVEVLADNSFLVAGGSTGGGLGGTDAMLVKFAADGTVEWAKSYGGSGYDIFTHIYPCSDGNFLAVGTTTSMGGGAQDIYVVKVDLGGNVLWERTCGGYSNDGHRGSCEVSDGYIISGSTTSFGAGGFDIYVEKLDLSGNSVWRKAWGNSGDDIGGEPYPASNNEVWISGYISGAGNNIESVLLRISGNGTLISATQVNGAHGDLMIYLAAGGAGLSGSGSTASYSGGSQQQPFLLGFNTSGNLVWAKRYLLSSGSYDSMVEDCPDGGFVFTPYRLSGNESSAYLVKADGSGNISWAKSYTLTGGGRMYHARPAPDGGYVAIGHCVGVGQDIYIIKTDASGNITGCCAEDAPITAAVITPATPSVSLSNANGSPALSVVGEDLTMTFTETNICNGSECCSTDAGSVLVETQNVCINEQATFTHNDDEVLDNNDLLQFILFSNPNDTLGSIISISNTPVFIFNTATMQTGVTYYIAAIAGNNVGGNVDLNDPCLDISNAAQLIWQPLPEVAFSVANPDVCAGGCISVTATFTGTPPFTLTYSAPGLGPTTQIFSSNTGTFQVCPPPNAPAGGFSVQATALADGFCTCL
jgi:hypothetical protein